MSGKRQIFPDPSRKPEPHVLGRRDDLGPWIALERLRLGMSQDDLGNAAGTSQMAVSAWEHGQDMRLSRLIEVAHVLGFKVILAPDEERGLPDGRPVHETHHPH